MDTDIKTWLYDILQAIIEIEGFFADRAKEFAAYQADVRTRRAVERNVEIIGEAMNRILNSDESVVLSNARNIVNTRNRIIHGYDTVSDEIIWSIVIKHLPILKGEIAIAQAGIGCCQVALVPSNPSLVASLLNPATPASRQPDSSRP